MLGRKSVVDRQKYVLPAIVFILIFSLVAIFVSGSTGNEPAFSRQLTYTLDPDAPSFNYSLSRFNDTTELITLDFNASSTQTIGFILPKNSTITNVEFNISGVIKPYTTCIGTSIGSNNDCTAAISTEITDIDIGEVISGSAGQEIGITTSGATNTVNTTFIADGSGSVLLAKKSATSQYPSRAIEIGPFIGVGNESVVGGDYGINVYDSSGAMIWNYSSGTKIYSIALENITGSPANELVYGDENGNVVMLNSTSNVTGNLCNFSTSFRVDSLAVSDINNDGQAEILAASNLNVYALNSTCGLIWNYGTLTYVVNAISVGNLTSDNGKEIVLGTKDGSSGNIYLLNSTGDLLWNRTNAAGIASVGIGEFDSQNPGPEIICGGEDFDIHVLRSTGEIFWSYLTGTNTQVSALSIGNVSVDTGTNINEIVLGTKGTFSASNLQILNFDSFPTNTTLNIGSDGTIEWNYSIGDGRLRNSTIANSTAILNSINNYLSSNCTSDLCTVPLSVHTDNKGILTIGLNITYAYNATSDISYRNISYWAKTGNISVNESIIARAKNITFSDPAINITVKYIKVAPSSVQCGFGGVNYTSVLISGETYCNISLGDSGFLSRPAISESKILWDDTMAKEVPVMMTASPPYYTTGIDRNFWNRNITLQSNNTFNSFQTFSSITANMTVNDSSSGIRGSEYLNVTWGGVTCDIIPSAPQADCDSAAPSFTLKTCNGGNFYVCKKDMNSNGVFEFIKWLHPYLSAIQSVLYRIGGSSNLPPIASSENVSPKEAAWNTYFNYSLSINDTENDLVNVSLYTYSGLSGAWIYRGSKNTTVAGIVWFNISLGKEMSGTSNKYRFEYQDFNSSWSSPLHSANNTIDNLGANVTRHNITITEISGNMTHVLRNANSTYLSVRINDTTQNQFINETSVECVFNVTHNGVGFNEGYVDAVNESGYCNLTFAPDASYSVGLQTWMATVDPRYYASPSPPVNFTLHIMGALNISLVDPVYNQAVMRGSAKNMTAHLIDDSGNDVNSSTLNVSDYACSWYFNSTYLGTSAILSSGDCNYTYTPGCGYSVLSDYPVEVRLNYTKIPGNYTISANASQASVRLLDSLSIIISSPVSSYDHYRGNVLAMNSVLNDSCGTVSLNNRTVSWYENLDAIVIRVNETGGLARINSPLVITGAALESAGANLTGWLVNSTKVAGPNGTIQNKVFDSAGIYINSTSKIVFLVNATAYSNSTYYLSHNQPQISGNYSISYISNGGFEANATSNWTTDGTVVALGTEPRGSRSLKLYAFDFSQYESAVTTFSPLTTRNVKFWYKQEGQYDSSANPKVSLNIGAYSCILPLAYPTSAAYNGSWRSFTCNDSSIIGATNISLSINGSIASGSTLYIDQVCVADDSGNCISEDSGLALNTTIAVRELLNTTSAGNATWSVPLTHVLGMRDLTAVASGSYYIAASNTTGIDIYGQSRMSAIGYSSAGCDGSLCFTGSVIDLSCKVIDSNNSQGIFNYSVSFYDNGTWINTNKTYTDSAGNAFYSWTSIPPVGNHEISCNITDSGELYYNATTIRMNSTTITLFDDDTNATLSFVKSSIYLNSTYEVAYNLSKTRNDIINLTVFINNTGYSVVSSPEIIGYNATGIEVYGGAYAAISAWSNRTVNMTLNVSRYASTGNNTLNVTLVWANNGTRFINQTIVLNVTSTAILDIVNKTVIRYSIPYGGTKTIGNFTIEAYGNTRLDSILLALKGGDSAELGTWSVTYSNNSFDLDKYQNKTISITMTAPENASLLGRSLYAYVSANATATSCVYSFERCNDSIMFNITIIDQDWRVTPEDDITETVGIGGKEDIGSVGDLINITNLKDRNLTIDLSISNQSAFLNFTYIFNGTIYALGTARSTFTIPPQSFANINITYNISKATVSDTKTYDYNITMQNLDNDAVPVWINKSISFTISALNLDILSPNSTSRSTGIISGDTLNMTFNVTYNGNILGDAENTTFGIKVGGVNCTLISSTFITQSNIWFINCTAPVIPQNPENNSIDATVNYRTPSGSVLSYTASVSDLVGYKDLTSPIINWIRINSVLLDPVLEANILYTRNIPAINFTINITDNVEVKSAWMILTDPDGSKTGVILSKNNTYHDLWHGNYTNPNIIGDYNITIFANDSIANHTVVSTAWFDVYNDIGFTDTMEDASNSPVAADFEIYRPGSSWMFHRFSTDSGGFYNWTVHQRTYDMKIAALGQVLRFNNFNITSSAMNKTGDSNPLNLSGAIKLHLIANSSPETNASNIDLPNTAENILMAFVIHTPQTRYDNVTVELHYADALLSSWTSKNSESDLRLYYCSDWDFNSMVCAREFSEFNSSLQPNVSANTFTFTTTHNSAYALAKWCGGNVCSSSPPASGSTAPSGGDSGGASISKSVCGNRVCEFGESEENCPEDCSYHTCGNGICEPTENNDNCPLDCGREEFSYLTDPDFTKILIAPGETQMYNLTLMNNKNTTLRLGIEVAGEISDYMEIIEKEVNLEARSNKTLVVYVRAGKDTIPDQYSGSIRIKSETSLYSIPVLIKVSETSEKVLTSLDMAVEILTKKVTPDETLRFNVMLYDLGIVKEFNATLRYQIKDSKSDKIFKTIEETISLTESTSLRKSIDLNKLDLEIPQGQYFLEVTAVYGGGRKEITATDTFEVVESFFATTRGQALSALVLLFILSIISYYAYKRYKLWKQSKARYVFPVDYSKLPGGDNPFSVGYIAETEKKALFNPDDLTTHVLVAGSTGAGKSVSASVFVEEALRQKIPVVVFDPTAQWTGFVKACKDQNLLKFYPDFGMREQEAHPFTGMIFEVTDPNVKVDFKKYMNPGEITVFTLNKLKPGEYDTAVANIIDTIFSITWEESAELKMIVVFDEVHRLLEKYGGKGGYISLEKACREFRKWGIGLIMCSQVYSDFKEAIQGNILTEIQLNTKSLSDIAKVKEKYGAVYSEKISRQGIGVGMIQNPKYNDGKPWFIHFRPTLHSPHKITEDEMRVYKDFAAKLGTIEEQIEKLKSAKINVMDLELELKLAKTKLKQGQFKMAEIYLESLAGHKILDKLK